MCQTPTKIKGGEFPSDIMCQNLTEVKGGGEGFRRTYCVTLLKKFKGKRFSSNVLCQTLMKVKDWRVPSDRSQRRRDFRPALRYYCRSLFFIRTRRIHGNLRVLLITGRDLNDISVPEQIYYFITEITCLDFVRPYTGDRQEPWLHISITWGLLTFSWIPINHVSTFLKNHKRKWFSWCSRSVSYTLFI